MVGLFGTEKSLTFQRSSCGKDFLSVLALLLSLFTALLLLTSQLTGFALYTSAAKKECLTALLFCGGDGGIRTHDLRVANAALSQLSYTPVLRFGVIADFFPRTMLLYHKLCVCQALFANPPSFSLKVRSIPPQGPSRPSPSCTFRLQGRTL